MDNLLPQQCSGKKLWFLLKELKTRFNNLAIFLLPENLAEPPAILMRTMSPIRKSDWITFANEFLEDKLGFNASNTPHKLNIMIYWPHILMTSKRINTILIDFCRDIWTYISMDYFKQQIKKGEIGAVPCRIK